MRLEDGCKQIDGQGNNDGFIFFDGRSRLEHPMNPADYSVDIPNVFNLERGHDEKQHFLQKLPHSRRIISAREKWKLDSQLLTRQDTGNKGTDFPSHQYQHQLNEIFMTEDEADDFAAQKAMEWITKD